MVGRAQNPTLHPSVGEVGKATYRARRRVPAGAPGRREPRRDGLFAGREGRAERGRALGLIGALRRGATWNR